MGQSLANNPHTGSLDGVIASKISISCSLELRACLIKGRHISCTGPLRRSIRRLASGAAGGQSVSVPIRFAGANGIAVTPATDMELTAY